MRRLLAPLLAVAISSMALLAPAAGAHETEILRYSWNLGGFLGTFARIFIPGRGDGALVTRSAPSGNLEVELDITAPAAKGEYWRYGAEIDPKDGTTLRAWNAYRFRGEDKQESSDLGDKEVIDIASGILLLRREQPRRPLNLRIWNDGKQYPVVVLPRGRTWRRVGGQRIATDHYAIRARRVPGERLWKGKLDIYLADDDTATPVEIVLERRAAKVKLELEDGDSG